MDQSKQPLLAADALELERRAEPPDNLADGQNGASPTSVSLEQAKIHYRKLNPTGSKDIVVEVDTAPARPDKQAESADFDSWDSAVYEAELSTKGEWYYKRRALHRWILLFFIGACTGLNASFLTWTSRLLTSWKFNVVDDLINKEQAGILGYGTSVAAFIAISIVYGALASIPSAFIEPVSAGSGIPEIKVVLNGVIMPKVLRLRTLLCKVTGLVFSVSSGLPVGKEGPMIHAGAVIASGLSMGKSATFGLDTRWSVNKDYRNDKERRDMVVCGTAAGVAAAFGAPVGGVLFAIEEGASFWYRVLTWRSFFCAIVATYTIDFFLSGLGVPGESSGSWGTLGTPGMFSFGQFSDKENTWSFWEIPVFIAVGACGGLVGAAFIAFNRRISLWRFAHVPAAQPYRRFGEAILIVAINAALKFCISIWAGNCKPMPGPDEPGAVYASSLVQLYCVDGHYNEMASLFMTPSEDAIRQLFHFTNGSPFSLLQLALFFVLYTFMATVTYGIALPAGLFIPSLLSGSAMGRLIGEIINSIAGFAIVDAGTYSLVGAAAVLGGNTRMTISLAVIVLECTGNYQFALPLMIVLYTARWIGNLFNEGIYDLHIKLRKWPILHDDVPRALAHALRACDVMSKRPVVLQEIEKVGRIFDILTSCSHSGFPVVYSAAAMKAHPRLGSMAGLIERKHLMVLLAHKIFHAELPHHPFVPKQLEASGDVDGGLDNDDHDAGAPGGTGQLRKAAGFIVATAGMRAETVTRQPTNPRTGDAGSKATSLAAAKPPLIAINGVKARGSRGSPDVELEAMGSANSGNSIHHSGSDSTPVQAPPSGAAAAESRNRRSSSGYRSLAGGFGSGGRSDRATSVAGSAAAAASTVNGNDASSSSAQLRKIPSTVRIRLPSVQTINPDTLLETVIASSLSGGGTASAASGSGGGAGGGGSMEASAHGNSNGSVNGAGHGGRYGQSRTSSAFSNSDIGLHIGGYASQPGTPVHTGSGGPGQSPIMTSQQQQQHGHLHSFQDAGASSSSRGTGSGGGGRLSFNGIGAGANAYQALYRDSNSIRYVDTNRVFTMGAIEESSIDHLGTRIGRGDANNVSVSAHNSASADGGPSEAVRIAVAEAASQLHSSSQTGLGALYGQHQYLGHTDGHGPAFAVGAAPYQPLLSLNGGGIVNGDGGVPTSDPRANRVSSTGSNSGNAIGAPRHSFSLAGAALSPGSASPMAGLGMRPSASINSLPSIAENNVANPDGGTDNRPVVMAGGVISGGHVHDGGGGAAPLATSSNNSGSRRRTVSSANGGAVSRPSLSAASIEHIETADPATMNEIEDVAVRYVPDDDVIEFVYDSEPLLRWEDFEGHYPRYPEISNIRVHQEERNMWIDLRPYMNPTPFTVHLHAPLDRAFRLFRQHGLRHLVVINDCHDVVGIISRADLLPDVLETRLKQRTVRRMEHASDWWEQLRSMLGIQPAPAGAAESEHQRA